MIEFISYDDEGNIREAQSSAGSRIWARQSPNIVSRCLHNRYAAAPSFSAPKVT